MAYYFFEIHGCLREVGTTHLFVTTTPPSVDGFEYINNMVASFAEGAIKDENSDSYTTEDGYSYWLGHVQRLTSEKRELLGQFLPTLQFNSNGTLEETHPGYF